MKIIIAAVIFLLSPVTFAQASPVFTMTEALKLALENSPTLKSAKANQEAAEASANAADSGLYPKLFLDGNYRKQSVVPTANVGNQKLQLTDDHSYSIGPTLSFVLWDSGLTRDRVQALEFLAKAKKNQSDLTEAQVMLATEIAYIQAALASENLILSSRAAELSKVQNKDIAARVSGGSATKLDALNADSEVLNYQLKVEQAESELQANLTDLNYFTGSKLTRQTQFEPLSNLIESTDSQKRPKPTNVSNHPLIASQIQLEKSSLSQASAQKAHYWPTLTFQARSSLDYPNGPTFEEINQNSLGLNLTWTLIDFGGNKNEVAAKTAEARATSLRRKDAEQSLARDLEKTSDKIESIKKQMKDSDVFVRKQEQLAKLNYSTYKFGGIRFSDVQSANLRLLDAQNRLSLIRAQYLVQVFTLQYLSQGASDE